MNPYEILGVDPAASAEEIRSAYLALAKKLHPDQNPSASEAERARLSGAMATVNEAYALLQDAERRNAYDRDRFRPGGHAVRETVGGRPPRPGECTICGASPARQLRFEHQSAFLLWARLYHIEIEMCRSCGLSIGRAAQNHTLLAGWWGLLALLRNLVVVVRNTVNLSQAAGLTDPSRPADEVMVPLGAPLAPGRPVWLRGGAALIAVAAMLTGSAVIAASSDPSPSDRAERSATVGSDEELQVDLPTNGPDDRWDDDRWDFEPDDEIAIADPPPPIARWGVGGCVRGVTWVEPVPCSEPHDGEIIAVVSHPFECPYAAESYVEDAFDVWCIEDR